MSQIDTALRDFRTMDELSMRDSIIHRLNALSKFIITIIYIAFVVSMGKYELNKLVIMFLYPWLMFELSGTSFKGFFVRLRYVLPLVMAVGIVNPFLDRVVVFTMGIVPVTGGVISMITLMLKGVFTIMASYVLVATTRFDAICAALARIHMPSIFVTMLLLTYRYISVMMDELAIMNSAYKLRAPGQKGIHYKAWGSFLGQMFLRSMDRAEELFAAMQLRGFDEKYRYVKKAKIKAEDVVYIILTILLLLLFKNFDVVSALGSLIV